MIQTLATRWNGKVVSYAEKLSGKITCQLMKNAGFDIDGFVAECVEDYEEDRGKTSNTLIHAAVCRAVLSRRPGYLEELFDSNPLKLAN